MKTTTKICLIAIAALNLSTSCFSQEPQHTACNNTRLITISSPAGIGMVRNAVSRSEVSKAKSALNTKTENTSVGNKIANNNDTDYEKLAYNGELLSKK